MHAIFVVSIFFLIQNSETNEVTLQNEKTTNLLLQDHGVSRALVLAEKNDNLLGINDVWNNIKNTATKIWNSIKNMAENARDKISAWIKDIKDRAKNVAEAVKNRLKVMNEKLQEIIENLFGDGEIVKNCIKEESDALEEIILQIVEQVSTCISNNIGKLTLLENNLTKLDLNDSMLIDIEDKLILCLNEGQLEKQECFDKVRIEIYEEMDDVENDILKRRVESRGIVDDLLDAIISCSAEGLLAASTAIAYEALQIVKCILEGQTSS